MKHRLKELLTIHNGKDYRQHHKGTIPVYGTGGIVTCIDTSLHTGESILLPRKGSLRNIMYVNGSFWTVDTMYWTTINTKLADAKYLYYYLSLLDLSSRDTGSTLPSMTSNSYYELEIDLPPLQTQKTISQRMAIIDQKIAINNVISKDLESLTKTVYDYWFLQFEFPNKDGRPYKSNGGKMVWNDRLKQEIPEGWKVGTLDQLFEITMGTSPKGNTLNQDLNGIEFYQGSTDFGQFYPESRVYTTNPIKRVSTQDVLLSVRAPVGALNIAPNDCCIGRGLAGIHYERSSLYAWNKLKSFQKYFDKFNGNGTTFGSLTGEMLKKLVVIIPDIKVIESYANKTHAIEEAIRAYHLENQKLKSLRDFLLPLLMNGQVSINS